MATNVAALALAVALWSAAVAPVTIARAGGPIALGTEPVRVWLEPVDGDASLAARLERLGPDRQVFLVLNGLSAETQPGTAFAIYLDPPAGGNRAAANNESPRVGRITFYEEVRAGRTAVPTTFRSFDVTARLHELRAMGRLNDSLAVTIVPERKTAGEAKAAIANIELVAR